MIRKMGSFRSYVGLEEYELKGSRVAGKTENVKPKFLEGEIVVSEAVNVLKFTSATNKKGYTGSLFVTNARVIFVPADGPKEQQQESLSLLSINRLWYYECQKGSTKKQKHLVKLGISTPNPLPSGSSRILELLIGCSTFTTSRFSFKFSPIDQGMRICNAIFHHAFPERLELLFYFDFAKVTSASWRKTVCESTVSVPSFLQKTEWMQELMNTNSTVAFRISTVNEKFNLCDSLPEWIVVPSDLNDVRLVSLAEKLKDSRPPHWSWSNGKGACIIRMAKIMHDCDSPAENAFFELMRKVNSKPPEILDLDKELPVKEIRAAFSKLFDLVIVEKQSQIVTNDSKFLSALESSKWLTMVSKCLSLVSYARNAILTENSTIILQENKSRDTACVVSSLIQLVVDPRFRTCLGFFTLIQKEWIAFGHAFHSKYMHSSPVFLLFLDCVFQLTRQNILDFEFNDQLLVNVWDSCFDSTRGTFLFDTPRERKQMDRWNEYTSWPVILEDVGCDSGRSGKVDNDSTKLLPSSLSNALFRMKMLVLLPSSTKSLINVLNCTSSICDLKFWDNLYINRNFLYHANYILVKQQLGFGTSMLSEAQAEIVPVSPSVSPSLHAEPSFTMPVPGPVGFSAGILGGSASSLLLGRNYDVESSLVELLLSTNSSATRYRRFEQKSKDNTSNPYLRKVFEKDKSKSVAPPVPKKPTSNSVAFARKNPFYYQ